MTLTPTLVDSPLARRALRELVCTQFETAWKAGNRPDLDKFMTYVSAEECNELLRELLPLDAHYRSKAGENPNADDYCPGSLEQAEIINDFFAATLTTPTSTESESHTHSPFPQAPRLHHS